MGGQLPMQAPLTAQQAQALADQGLAALRQGQAAQARGAFARIVAAGLASADLHLALAHAHRLLGDRPSALDSIDAALALQPRDIGALVFKGDLLDADAQASAAAYYQAALRCAEALPAVPSEWQSAVAHAQAMCDRYAKHFDETLRAHLTTVVPRHGPPSARFAQSLDLLSGHKQIYLPAPRLYYLPELPAAQFHDRSMFPWIAALEAASGEIRQELLALMRDPQDFAPYVRSDPLRPALRKDGMLDNPVWSALFLWQDGQRVNANADRCPATLAALAAVPVVNIPGRSPSILFSLMRPGAHIPAHHGFINTRLIVHLPLIVPAGCRFRVGNETRDWVEGRAWLFDDTIEHEAWNPSGQDRVVLIFEVWRPELSVAERAYVSALFESIGQQRGGVGDWGI